jgi:hypothetical protein
MSLHDVFHRIDPMLTEEQIFQLAQRLYNASRTYFEFFWFVADGEGAYDKKGRKIPPYGVCVQFEARVAEYIRATEEKLLEQLRGLTIEELDIYEAALQVYQAALEMMCLGYKKWEARGNSDISQDDKWNNPSQGNLSKAMKAINKQLEKVRIRIASHAVGY